MMTTTFADYFQVEDYKVHNDQFVCRCPCCGKESHLYASLKNKFYVCFKCGHKGKVKGDFVDLVDDELQDKVAEIEAQNFVDENEVELTYDISRLTPALRYFKSKEYLINTRGLSESDVDFYNIKYDFYRDQIVFPNQVGDGKTDMFVARTLMPRTEDEKPYKFPKGSNPGKVIYNLHNVKDEDYVIITEGVINAIVAGRQAVALYSKFCSKDQFQLLIERKFKAYYIALDYDAKSWAFQLACKLHRCFKKVFLVNFRDDRDVADLGKEGFHQMMMDAIPFDDKLKVSLFFM